MTYFCCSVLPRLVKVVDPRGKCSTYLTALASSHSCGDSLRVRTLSCSIIISFYRLPRLWNAHSSSWCWKRVARDAHISSTTTIQHPCTWVSRTHLFHYHSDSPASMYVSLLNAFVSIPLPARKILVHCHHRYMLWSKLPRMKFKRPFLPQWKLLIFLLPFPPRQCFYFKLLTVITTVLWSPVACSTIL